MAKPKQPKTAQAKSKADVVEEGLKQQQKETYELVRLRNNFYRDSYRRLTLIMILMLITVLMCIGVVFFLINNKPQPRYFATNIYGGIIPLKGLSQPIAEQEVVQWASRAASNALTFNYVQYQGQLQQAVNVYFTPYGGKMYLKALQDSLNLDNVIKNKYLQVAEPTAAPRILSKGVATEGSFKNRYYWLVQVPVQIEFYGSSGVNRFYQMVTLTIIRSSYFVENKNNSQAIPSNSLDQTKGIGVNQFVMQNINYREAIRNQGVKA